MKIIFRFFITIIFLALLAGTLYFLYDKSKEKPVIFDTMKPFYTDISTKAVATGSIVPRKEIEIKPQVSGVIERIFAEPGDTLRKGDLIAKLEIIPDMVTLNNAETKLNLARISRKNAEREFIRRKNLYDKGIISEADFLQHENDYSKAKEEVAAAESNLQLIRDGAKQQSKETTNTLVKSTIKGMILDIPVEVGDSVIEANVFNVGTTIATVADMTKMIFKGRVDESDVGKIKEGMNLLLTIGAMETEKYNATLEYIAPKGVKESGAIQFEIRAAVTLDPSQFLRAGYSATADIVFEQRKNVLALKESLLQFDGDTVFVEVETAPQQFKKRTIEVGLSDGINIEIVSGLSKTDRIKIWDKPRRGR
jgi:HlyD family secretion protein